MLESPKSWQEQLKQTVNNLSELTTLLELDIKQLSANLDPKFPLRAPLYYVNKIAKRNPQDPLLLQILPQKQESILQPNYCQDPLQEAKYLKAPGLIHKYYNRVLLTITGACGIHCRYCFRQYFPYQDNLVSQANRSLQLDYIKNNPQINEIILSGGDPLCASNKFLDNLLQELNSISHVHTVRFHSRMPIVIPDRIDDDLIKILNKYPRLKFILVTHCNHANELDNHIKAKMSLLRQNHVTLFNQTVLLSNINASADTLIHLSQKLFDCHIIPYYLHLLDPVQGTSHFDVDSGTAKKLMSNIKNKLPGYLVPKLVREIPGEYSKTLIN